MERGQGEILSCHQTLTFVSSHLTSHNLASSRDSKRPPTVVQLRTNTYLHDLFGADMSVLLSEDGMSSLEKRLFKSKSSASSKKADKKLNRERAKRNNVKNDFLTKGFEE